jgi:hypothetical protein
MGCNDDFLWGWRDKRQIGCLWKKMVSASKVLKPIMHKKISLLLCTLFFATVLMAQNLKQEPPHPPPPPPVENDAPPVPGKEQVDIPQKNRIIENMHWSESGRKLHIQYKDGRTEVYKRETNQEANKMPGGTMPPPPPPPAVK